MRLAGQPQNQSEVDRRVWVCRSDENGLSPAALGLGRGRACEPPRTGGDKHSEQGKLPPGDRAAADSSRPGTCCPASHPGQLTLLMTRSATAYRSLWEPLSPVAPTTVALTVTRPSEAASDAMLTG